MGVQASELETALGLAAQILDNAATGSASTTATGGK